MGTNPLLQLFAQKMDYLTQKQAQIAKNVASANIPGYRPMELEDFSSVLEKKMSGGTSASSSIPKAGMVLTNANHINGTASSSGGATAYATHKEKDVYEVKPSGNAVVLEEQLTNLSQTNQDYATMTGLYRKMASMLKTAIGHRG